jgi:L-alanine-DL-glutamate epimerase-like enolase superfamily enzyme
MIQRLHVEALRIPFRQRFRHASASRRVTQSLWVEVELQNGARGFGEACPREYVTGESLESAEQFIHDIEPSLADIGDLPALRDWVHDHRVRIDAAPAAWCAVELALLDALARAAGQPIEAFLGIPPVQGSPSYTAVLGAETPAIFEKQFQRYLDIGFRDYKVKLSGEDNDLERLALLKMGGDSIDRLRFDANNLWKTADEAIAALERLAAPAFAIEEPVAPGDLDSAAVIANATGLRIILDESILRVEQLARIEAETERWILNLRVSKMGGLLRSIEFADRARDLGIPLILGCQVGETSLLTRAALTVAADQWTGDVIAREGAFGTLLLAADVIEPPLQFEQGGALVLNSRGYDASPGFGMSPVLPRESTRTAAGKA